MRSSRTSLALALGGLLSALAARAQTPVNGFKPLMQYGVGLRGRTKLSSESNVRLAWRVELMRFRRGYQDDTFVCASLGTAF